ncbi:hypothetical protein C8R43DRAFT_323507 [Mycena crocata]|nr:hypothetical protein C8R43DRAFT_323507 [Mycena crocata]
MNPRVVRVRVLVILSFVCFVAFQGYALFNQRVLPETTVYAPHPYFLVAFFAMQVGLQFFWIGLLLRSRKGTPISHLLLPGEEEETGIRVEPEHAIEPTQMAYVHTYFVGNIFIAGAAAAWNFEHFIVSQILMAFNTACQLYFVFFFLSLPKYLRTRKNRLTHLVAKSSSGVAVLYMWRAWGVLEVGSSRPAIQQQVHCGVLFLLLVFASGPDPTLGICLLLDLAALAVGNAKEEWRTAFLGIMGVLSVVIVSDSVLAWKDKHAQSAVSHPHIGLEDEETALFRDHDLPHDQIYMSDFRPESSGRIESEARAEV